MSQFKKIIVSGILASTCIYTYAATYEIEIQNSNKVAIYNGVLTEHSLITQQDDNTYTENCLVDTDGIAELKKGTIKTGLVAKINQEKSLLELEFTQVLGKKKILVEGCYIEDPIIGKYVFTQEVPFIMAENRIYLNKSTPKVPYYLKITRK